MGEALILFILGVSALTTPLLLSGKETARTTEVLSGTTSLNKTLAAAVEIAKKELSKDSNWKDGEGADSLSSQADSRGFFPLYLTSYGTPFVNFKTAEGTATVKIKPLSSNKAVVAAEAQFNGRKKAVAFVLTKVQNLSDADYYFNWTSAEILHLYSKGGAKGVIPSSSSELTVQAENTPPTLFLGASASIKDKTDGGGDYYFKGKNLSISVEDGNPHLYLDCENCTVSPENYPVKPASVSFKEPSWKEIKVPKVDTTLIDTYDFSYDLLSLQTDRMKNAEGVPAWVKTYDNGFVSRHRTTPFGNYDRDCLLQVNVEDGSVKTSVGDDLEGKVRVSYDSDSKNLTVSFYRSFDCKAGVYILNRDSEDVSISLSSSPAVKGEVGRLYVVNKFKNFTADLPNLTVDSIYLSVYYLYPVKGSFYFHAGALKGGTLLLYAGEGFNFYLSADRWIDDGDGKNLLYTAVSFRENSPNSEVKFELPDGAGLQYSGYTREAPGSFSLTCGKNCYLSGTFYSFKNFKIDAGDGLYISSFTAYLTLQDSSSVSLKVKGKSYLDGKFELYYYPPSEGEASVSVDLGELHTKDGCSYPKVGGYRDGGGKVKLSLKSSRTPISLIDYYTYPLELSYRADGLSSIVDYTWEFNVRNPKLDVVSYYDDLPSDITVVANPTLNPSFRCGTGITWNVRDSKLYKSFNSVKVYGYKRHARFFTYYPESLRTGDLTAVAEGESRSTYTPTANVGCGVKGKAELRAVDKAYLRAELEAFSKDAEVSYLSSECSDDGKCPFLWAELTQHASDVFKNLKAEGWIAYLNSVALNSDVYALGYYPTSSITGLYLKGPNTGTAVVKAWNFTDFGLYNLDYARVQFKSFGHDNWWSDYYFRNLKKVEGILSAQGLRSADLYADDTVFSGFKFLFKDENLTLEDWNSWGEASFLGTAQLYAKEIKNFRLHLEVPKPGFENGDFLIYVEGPKDAVKACGEYSGEPEGLNADGSKKTADCSISLVYWAGWDKDREGTTHVRVIYSWIDENSYPKKFFSSVDLGGDRWEKADQPPPIYAELYSNLPVKEVFVDRKGRGGYLYRSNLYSKVELGPYSAADINEGEFYRGWWEPVPCGILARKSLALSSSAPFLPFTPSLYGEKKNLYTSPPYPWFRNYVKAQVAPDGVVEVSTGDGGLTAENVKICKSLEECENSF